MKKNPNLLFIFTDQQRYDTMRAYGNDKIKVPNLNKLAEKSAVFKRAYDTQPVCTPARGTIMTGLYPHNHGATENNIPLNNDARTIPEYTKNTDYKSSYIGKWHLGDEVIRQHGFDEWVSQEDNYRHHYTREEYKSIHSSYCEFLIGNGFLPDIEEGDFQYFSRLFSTRLPEQYSRPAFLAKEATNFINRNKDNNFILYVNFLEPHPPYYSSFDNMYGPDDIELPENFNCELDETVPLKYKFNRYYQEKIGRQFPMKDEKTWRKLISRYWGAISLVDKYTGKILDCLKESGLENDTIIVFTSDHGDMMGDFNMMLKGVMLEPAVRIPMIVRIPGITDTQKIIEEPVSQVDLVPTLLEALNIHAENDLDGKSLLPVIKEETGLSNNNDVFIEWNGSEGENKWYKVCEDKKTEKKIKEVYGSPRRTVVTHDGWKMSLSTAGENELYNLKSDPYERTNLYFDISYAPIIKKLGKKIFEWQEKTGDTVSLNI